MKILQLTLLFILTLQVSLVAQDREDFMFNLTEDPETEWAAKAPADLKMAAIEINNEIIESIRSENIDRFLIPLLDGNIHEIHVQRILEQRNQNWSITGWVGGEMLNSFILSKSGDSIFASISQVTHHSFYEIIYNHDRNSYVLLEVDPHKRDDFSCGADHLPEVPEMPQPKKDSHPGQSFQLNNMESPAMIDVMIVYTPAAKEWAENNVSGGIENVLNQAMARAQLTVDNSEVDITFRLVHSGMVDYDESSTSSLTDIYRLTASPAYNPWGPEYAGYMDEVHYWREMAGADLVALLSTDSGGIAWTPTGSTMNDRLGFSQTAVQIAMSRVFTHELGHNMGSAHSRNQNANAAGSSGGRTEYATGWRWTGNNDVGYASVMTYLDGDVGVDLFSNPDVLFEGVPTGSYDEENPFAPADNSKSLNEIKHVIASYRPEGGIDIPFITASEKELSLVMSANEIQSTSVVISNQGNHSLEYDIEQGFSFLFDDFSSSGGDLQRLNDQPLSGTLTSVNGNFVLESQGGESQAQDLAVRVTETPDYSNANVVYQFGGWFSPTVNVTYWQHGWGTEPGTGVKSTILPNNPITSDNFYFWVGNTRTPDSNSGTWSGSFEISGVMGADDIEISIFSGTGTISPESDQTVTLEIDATDKLPGLYQTNITIVSNDPIQPSVIIPITIEVIEDEPVFTLSYREGWNLIGVPVETTGIVYSDIFTNSTGKPFSFNYTYQEESEVIPGNGYWIHLDVEETVSYTDNQLEFISINLHEGWNLVSGLGYPIPEAAVEDNLDIINSAWYGFDGAYFSAAEIEPGYGYWVRASDEGSISLEYSISKILASQENQQPWQRFKANDEFYSLHFIAETDTLQTLYFGAPLPADVPLSRFEMPPVPPIEVFDVRFAAIESYLTESSNPRIELQGGGRDIDIHLQAAAQASMARIEITQLANDGRELKRQELRDGELVSLYSLDVTRIELIPQDGQYAENPNLPAQFALEQNYPNPFNPTAQIRYQLPVASQVNLSVYDMTGRHVGTLINGQVSAGLHSVTFDASSLSSGVYIYRLQAGEFQQVRRLTVIK